MSWNPENLCLCGTGSEHHAARSLYSQHAARRKRIRSLSSSWDNSTNARREDSQALPHLDSLAFCLYCLFRERKARLWTTMHVLERIKSTIAGSRSQQRCYMTIIGHDFLLLLLFVPRTTPELLGVSVSSSSSSISISSGALQVFLGRNSA